MCHMSNQQPPHLSHPNIDLVRGLFCLFSDNLINQNNWGFYLFSPEFDDERGLQNRIGTIWLVSLLDSLEGELRYLADYRQKATERNLPHLVEVCDQASLFMDCIKEILRQYTRPEQILLNDFRDQLVHSWLARRLSTSKFSIKYFDGTKIVKESMTVVEHSNIIRHYYLDNVLDDILQELMGRFKNLNLRYWHVIADLKSVPDITYLQQEMLSGKSFRIDALTRPIDGPVVITFR